MTSVEAKTLIPPFLDFVKSPGEKLERHCYLLFRFWNHKPAAPSRANSKRVSLTET